METYQHTWIAPWLNSTWKYKCRIGYSIVNNVWIIITNLLGYLRVIDFWTRTLDDVKNYTLDDVYIWSIHVHKSMKKITNETAIYYCWHFRLTLPKILTNNNDNNKSAVSDWTGNYLDYNYCVSYTTVSCKILFTTQFR